MTSIIDKNTFAKTTQAGKLAAIYIRVSSDAKTRNADGELEERESIPAQKEDGIAYANEQGWRYQVYDADCDISGTAEIADRPAMRQLMTDMASGKIHTVICRALDRLFRNHYEQDKFEALVVRHGITIKGLKEDIDFSTFEGRLVAGIKGRMAAQDVVKRGSESKKSKERKAKAGTLRIRPPLGYQIVEFDSIRSGKVKESEAALVREIFSRYIAGEGINQISKSLVARGATGKKNGQLNTSRISGIIHNPLYKGALVYKGQSYGSPYPAIIDAETWARANQQASRIGYKGGKVSTRNKSLLAGLIKCGHCHDRAKATGKAGYDYYIMQRLKQASGKQYNLYRCYSYARLGKATCRDSKSIMADVIEPFATDWLHRIVENSLNGKVDVRAAQAKLEFINGKLADLEAHKQTLAKLLGSKSL